MGAISRRFYTYRLLQLLNISLRENDTTYIGSTREDTHRWVNRNQRKLIVPPAGAVTINYNYGFVSSLVLNPEFLSVNGGLDFWTIASNDVALDADGAGLSYPSGNLGDVFLISEPQNVSEQDVLRFSYTFSFDTVQVQFPTLIGLSLQVILEGTLDTYYLNNNGAWVTTPVDVSSNYTLFNLSASQTLDRDMDPLPVSGELRVELKRIRTRQVPPVGLITDYTRSVFVSTFTVTPVVSENIEGERHIYQVANGSFRAEELLEVSIGDVPSDIYLGALYRADAETNTALWSTIFLPLDVAANQPLLQVLAEQLALYRRDPSLFIKGDVFGFFDVDTVFTMDLAPDRRFMITYYQYDTVNNVVSAEFKELRRGSTFGLSYQYELDYGNAEQTTVIG